MTDRMDVCSVIGPTRFTSVAATFLPGGSVSGSKTRVPRPTARPKHHKEGKECAVLSPSCSCWARARRY